MSRLDGERGFGLEAAEGGGSGADDEGSKVGRQSAVKKEIQGEGRRRGGKKTEANVAD